MSSESAFEKAIEAMGNKRRLAQALGITPQSVGSWTQVPVQRVLDVERITGVSRHELRPDIFGPPPPAPPASA